MGELPAVGTIFTLPNDVIPSVRECRWVVTSTKPGLVYYRIVGDTRVGKRPIADSLERWLEEAHIEEVPHG